MIGLWSGRRKDEARKKGTVLRSCLRERQREGRRGAVVAGKGWPPPESERFEREEKELKDEKGLREK